MADENTGVADAPVTQEDGSGVAEIGSDNISDAELAGLLAQSYPTEESEAVAEKGEGEAEEQDTNAEPETDDASPVEEATEESEDADEAEADDDEDVLSNLSEHAAKKARKRIGQLTARAKSAEEALEARNEQINQLQSRLEALEKSGSDEQKDVHNSFLDQVHGAETSQELQKLRDIAQQTKRFCRENLHKEYVELGKDENGEPRVIEHDELVQMLNDAEDVLEKEIPNRVKFLKSRAVVAQNAVKDFPAWKDKEHPDHKRLIGLWNDPVGKAMFHNVPNGVYLAGVMLEGIKAMEAKQSAAKKPAAEKAEQPKQTQQRVAPKVPGMESTSPPAKQMSDIEKNFQSKQSLSTDDLVSYFAAKAKSNK